MRTEIKRVVEKEMGVSWCSGTFFRRTCRNEMLQMAVLQPKLAILDEQIGGIESS